jgi:hypothetical protein
MSIPVENRVPLDRWPAEGEATAYSRPAPGGSPADGGTLIVAAIPFTHPV